MNYFLCFKCQILRNEEDESLVKISNQATVYWCLDCVAKHLNTSEVNK